MANVIRIGGGGGGQNLTLPPMVSNLAASTGDQSITLTWDNPDSDALAGVLIVYNDKHVPTKISDGTKVDVGLVETYELTGLTNETSYYIRLFPYNSKKQYQTMLEGATVTATPNDFPEEPTSYSEIKKITDSEEWIIPENGYYQIDIISKSGNGGASSDPYNIPRNGGGGGGSGAIARKSNIALFKNDIVSISFLNGSISIEQFSMSVTAGNNGTNALSSVTGAAGGTGGTASGGDTNINGLTGGTGGVVYNGSAIGGYSVSTSNSFGYSVVSGRGGNCMEGSTVGPGTAGTAAFAVLFRGNTNQPSPSTATVMSLTPRNASIEASWTNSGDPESVGTILVSNSEHIPVHPTDGTSVDVAEATSYTITDLPNNKPSYISLFAYNADKTKYSAARSDVEIPREVTWADTQDELEADVAEKTEELATKTEELEQKTEELNQTTEALTTKTEELNQATEELTQTTAKLSEDKLMVASAASTLSLLIVSDIQNETKVVTDNMILDNADMLSKEWKTGVPNEVGDIVWYMVGDVKQYYKVIQPTENADPNHTPNIVPAVFVAINKTNAGTIDDPIPAVRGMEYEYGKYYLDNEDGKIYICKRGEETGTIVLQYLPHELIGHYFELATLTE